jgi:hypothetical protein
MAKKVVQKKTVNTEPHDGKRSIADIAETLRSLKSKFGDEAIMTLDETKHVDIDSAVSHVVVLLKSLVQNHLVRLPSPSMP